MSKIILKYITKDKHTNTFCTEKNKKQYKNGFNSVQNMKKYQIYWYIYKNKKQKTKQQTKKQNKTKKQTERKKQIETNRHKSMFISSLYCMAMELQNNAFTSSVVDGGFKPRSRQFKYYKIVLCCFSITHTASRSKK